MNDRPTLSPRERYWTDSFFHTVVKQLYFLLRDAQTTPTELREAVMLAQQMVEEECTRPIVRSRQDDSDF
jgi:uracil phosphoribosyltransferase